MNTALEALVRELDLGSATNSPVRFAFGLACANRVRHLVEDPQAIAALDTLADYVAGRTDAPALAQAAHEVQQVANRHRGSDSIDGAAHAAVSATYAVANALAGRALQAADYAAYATVYAYGGYAVKDPESFKGEFDWQLGELRRLAMA